MTVLNGTISQRLQLLQEYTTQLHPYQQRSAEEISADTNLAWALQHGLQLAIQCVIDVCHRLVAQLGLRAPATSQDAIELLRDAGVFPPEFAENLVGMARFRNILVHAYAHVDLERVCEHLRTGLEDFGRFARCVHDFLAEQQAGGGSPP